MSGSWAQKHRHKHTQANSLQFPSHMHSSSGQALDTAGLDCFSRLMTGASTVALWEKLFLHPWPSHSEIQAAPRAGCKPPTPAPQMEWEAGSGEWQALRLEIQGLRVCALACHVPLLREAAISCLCIFHRDTEACAPRRRFNHDRQIHLSCVVETTLGNIRGWRKAAASDCLHKAQHVREFPYVPRSQRMPPPPHIPSLWIL